MLRDAWDRNAKEWISWARAPGHDQYWRYHRDAFLSLLPGPGRLTIDVGCGEGRLPRDMARLGHRVVEIDSSPAMATAAAKHPDAGGRVLVGDAAALPLPNDIADCVVAFMSLQDVDTMEAAVVECARVLSPSGHLVIAVTHPLNTAGRFSPGEGESDASRSFVIAGSWFERKILTRTADRDGHTMTFCMEHRPLQAYVDALTSAGLLIDRIREVADPDPADKWSRIPLFLHISAVRAE